MELIVDTLDGVDDKLKAVYVETDGKFTLDPDKYAEVQAQGLKKKNGELLGKLNSATTQVKGYERFKPVVEALTEADDEELTQFLEGWSKRGEENGNGKGKHDPEAAKQQEYEKKLHAKELKKRDDMIAALQPENEKLKAKLRDFELWTPLRELALKAGLFPEDWELARLHLNSKGQFGFDEDGKIVVMDGGEVSTVTPEKFFKEVYPDQQPKFYKPTGAGGSGAQGGTTNSKSTKTIKRSEWDALTQPERDAKVADKYVVVE